MKRTFYLIENVDEESILRKKKKKTNPTAMPEFFAQLVPDMVNEIFRESVVERRLVAMLCKANLASMEPDLYAYTVGDQRSAPGPTARNWMRLSGQPEKHSFAYRLARNAANRIFDAHARTHLYDMVRTVTRGWSVIGPRVIPVANHLLVGAAGGGHVDRVKRLLVAMRGFATMTGEPLAGVLGNPITIDSDFTLADAVNTQLIVAMVVEGRDSDAELNMLCMVIDKVFDVIRSRLPEGWTGSRTGTRAHNVLQALVRAGYAFRCRAFITRVLDEMPVICLSHGGQLVATALAASNSSDLLDRLAHERWFKSLLDTQCALAELRSPETVSGIGVLFRFSEHGLDWLWKRGITTLGGDSNTRCREWVAGTRDDPDAERALHYLRTHYGATDAQCA